MCCSEGSEDPPVPVFPNPRNSMLAETGELEPDTVRVATLGPTVVGLKVTKMEAERLGSRVAGRPVILTSKSAASGPLITAVGPSRAALPALVRNTVSACSATPSADPSVMRDAEGVRRTTGSGELRSLGFNSTMDWRA